MKPSRPPEALPRRGALLLAGGVLAAGASWLAWPRAAAPGFGPLHLGMTRAEALRALGPAALPAPLCGGVEGVLFDWPDPALHPRPVPAMAMFAATEARLSEMEASLSHPDGGLGLAEWQAMVAAQREEMARRLGTTPQPGPAEEDAMGAARHWRFAAAGAEVTLASRWMRRSGAGYTRLHWLAAGQEAVITG
ncbi:hypothetical protein EBE87_05395 [Pseudoroseomonas wenyumeiae]|uniref:Uncharacterized protein n=1 Tax=Teichococcus wenyumeiae TaxID=2478470 RepID=A0A3A9JRR3_9PROT|nr:hypothetical protein [Pseudoroseomonas wenyumeiae]RKK01629.1 hypothetical protein D6Z83_24000 [Pseudoroseomonas wenyumeiae]RMI26693.1 hypothetical protein EBE87_05395 [Pseudoroseomonas wenyumeiae]